MSKFMLMAGLLMGSVVSLGSVALIAEAREGTAAQVSAAGTDAMPVNVDESDLPIGWHRAGPIRTQAEYDRVRLDLLSAGFIIDRFEPESRCFVYYHR